MATTAHRAATGAESGALRLGASLMALAGLAFIGYAVIFFARNFTGAFLELGIGPAEVDVGRPQIRAFSPDLYEYISHLHIAVSGFIAATGLATAALAWFGVRHGLWWAYVTAVAVPVLALAVALPAHYPYGLATLGHLGLIYLATAVFAVGALVALKPMLQVRRT
ncbi:hypothetical protein GCM10010517_53340 [Streptosporangium fragile]|uniref:DUF2127 domain-containing protein n=1 Tax=Streptosporangium fragile TaxID=46186 RepID=A0ABN3W4P1_9ACTN